MNTQTTAVETKIEKVTKAANVQPLSDLNLKYVGGGVVSSTSSSSSGGGSSWGGGSSGGGGASGSW